MAYTTINKSSEHFNTKLYTGNGSSQTLDMDNLGLLWMKNRTETSNHNLFDSVRGGYYTSAPGPNLRSNGPTAGSGSDITSAYGITFGSSSSTIGSDGGGYNYNQNSKSYVGWQWRANGAGSANTDGSISSTVSANTTSGFSIVSYTGTGANATVGHGLGAVPKMIITKNLQQGNEGWQVYHETQGNTKKCALNETGGFATDATAWNSTTPTNNVFYIGTNWGGNGNGHPMIAYCFADVQGYSKFSSYIGNGNADGTFVYTGFKPAFVMFKGNNTSDWQLWDNKRDTFNPVEKAIHPNANGGASTDQDIDFLSNGFKIRSNQAHLNGSGVEFIYMAFAEAPLVGTNNVPCTAR